MVAGHRPDVVKRSDVGAPVQLRGIVEMVPTAPSGTSTPVVSHPTTKPTAFDVPPPGAGFVTVSCSVPTEPRSEPGTVAVSCVPLTYDVASPVAPICAVAPNTNELPLIVIAALGEPTTALGGVIDVTDGAGLE